MRITAPPLWLGRCTHCNKSLPRNKFQNGSQPCSWQRAPLTRRNPPKKDKEIKESKEGNVTQDEKHNDNDDKSLIQTDDKSGVKTETNKQQRHPAPALGRVVRPEPGKTGPRRLEGVPPGHYPPPGQCRVWYPDRAPGHQPPPADCRTLVNKPIEPGAFILHGRDAYDADFDWRTEERRNPGTVKSDVLDVLPPRR